MDPASGLSSSTFGSDSILSVPAMPVGSSGMEHRDYPHWGVEYNLPLIGKNGEVSSYTKHDPIH